VKYDVIIIGAGASGLMAAIVAARQGSSVLVMEQKDKAGKKILATGNGKCNFTNMIQSTSCYRSNDSAFAMKVLSCFDIKQTLGFFQQLGIYPKNRDGYLYPNSEQAVSVVQVLMMECERLKVSFHYQEAVKEIRKPDYSVVTEQSVYQADKLILATGGCASPQLGSDGSGYQLAKSLGHTIIKPLPALVQLKSPVKFCKTISGVRTTAKVTLNTAEKSLAMEEGEVLFTDYGISGIPILQISRYAAKALDQGEKVFLILDFIPELLEQELLQLIKIRISDNPHKNIEEMMVGLLNHKLSYVLIKEAGLEINKNVKQLNSREILLLVQGIKAFKLPISETNSFENAQVCAGGVATGEIVEETMESKLAKNVFLTGELVDVDGTCGGYNLQWAWSTGYLAGTAAGRKGTGV
jgi:predicted Rossmann fold flavoprotein